MAELSNLTINNESLSLIFGQLYKKSQTAKHISTILTGSEWLPSIKHLTHQVSKYMFFELHGVGNKMWPGVTSVHDELSVIIILEHGSFYQVPKLSNGAVNTSQLFKFHVLWRKRKKKLPIAVHIKCSIIIMIYFRIFLQHKSIIL